MRLTVRALVARGGRDGGDGKTPSAVAKSRVREDGKAPSTVHVAKVRSARPIEIVCSSRRR